MGTRDATVKHVSVAQRCGYVNVYDPVCRFAGMIRLLSMMYNVMLSYFITITSNDLTAYT